MGGGAAVAWLPETCPRAAMSRCHTHSSHWRRRRHSKGLTSKAQFTSTKKHRLRSKRPTDKTRRQPLSPAPAAGRVARRCGSRLPASARPERRPRHH
ncbi:hypothetical protein E2C01_083297 [Portunus trituberculatus]|uniref:Uncharacterized protein n=1 Tax=Portunus trituberculatus TaxID=210409 RepID=A0A5B7J7G0_PORTR|nr:hypothetical protein [Portunus trituberculatus]